MHVTGMSQWQEGREKLAIDIWDQLEENRDTQSRSFNYKHARRYPATENKAPQGRSYLSRSSPSAPAIPLFQGDISQYKPFRSLFNSVYYGSDIGYVERLTMLQSKLRGDAKRIINHLGVYGKDYAREWDFESRRFRNLRPLIEKEIQALFDVPQISPKDPKTLEMALDIMRSVVQNLLKAGTARVRAFHSSPSF